MFVWMLALVIGGQVVLPTQQGTARICTVQEVLPDDTGRSNIVILTCGKNKVATLVSNILPIDESNHP